MRIGANTSAQFQIIPGGVTITCTVNGGEFTVPAAPGNRSSTSVTMPYTTLPSFSSCSSLTTVTTSGRWTLTVTYGVPTTVTVNVPAGGLRVDQLGCTGTPSVAGSFTGSWQNGFMSPVGMPSALSMSGGPVLDWPCLGTSRSLGMSSTALWIRGAVTASDIPLVGL